MGDDREAMDALDHDLIDAGAGRRLDRFGTRLIDRPAPGAAEARLLPGAWAGAAARYTAGGWFAGPGLESPRIERPDPWSVGMGPLTFELRLSPTGQVGLFPEHALALPWFAAQARALDGTVPARILNLFAHTGLATLALSAEGASVTHVDASRPAVTQARRNAERSGLAGRPIRWIVDDALAFTQREARRGRTYHGALVDPPAYGHAGTRSWRLDERLGELLDAVAAILDPRRSFVLLTAHSTGVEPATLRTALAGAVGCPVRSVESGRLSLLATSGARLASGAFARTVIEGGPMRHDAAR